MATTQIHLSPTEHYLVGPKQRNGLQQSQPNISRQVASSIELNHDIPQVGVDHTKYQTDELYQATRRNALQLLKTPQNTLQDFKEKVLKLITDSKEREQKKATVAILDIGRQVLNEVQKKIKLERKECDIKNVADTLTKKILQTGHQATSFRELKAILLLLIVSEYLGQR